MSAAHPVDLLDQVLTRRAPAMLRGDDGSPQPLAHERWLGACCPVDDAIAAATTSPVLDIGCGPGRLLDALARHGRSALGIDLSPAAVGLAHVHGRQVRLGSVFGHVPGAGTWSTALLLDGSIGIGGDPALLLGRVRELLANGGAAIVEVEPPGAGTGTGRVRIEAEGRSSRWFDWARVDTTGIERCAAAAGFGITRLERLGGRWFAWLV